MFVYAADMAAAPEAAERVGVELRVEGVDWPGIVKRVFGRIDPIAAGGSDYRHNRCPNITVFDGHASFVSPGVMEVDGQQITAPQILLAAGSRPFIPALPGLEHVGYHTSDTVMRLDALPERIVILGGGYIAAELGHVFGSLGSDVTFVLRSPLMLRAEDGEALYRRCSATHHHHLVCRSCGRTVEVDGPAVERWADRVAAEHGYADVSHTLEIFGTCRDFR